jgi:hypothetical protein
VIINYAAKLSQLVPDAVPGGDPWYITHGFGKPAVHTYTEVVFTREVQQALDEHHPDPDRVRDEVVRRVANDLYGTSWAFHYPPAEYDDAIGRFLMIRRERVVVTAVQVLDDPPAYVPQLDAPLWRGTDLPDPTRVTDDARLRRIADAVTGRTTREDPRP